MRTVEQVSEWDSVPFDGGYEGLRALADREFSGAVVSGSTQLFMLNGRVVGILDGDLETFEDATGTARQAPHDALPLLVVMQARADEPRAQYYTEETPIADVDRTLTDGKFTGYVELSENVLSGDYYLVYHQGRSMSVAWVGSSQRLVTDDEAFEQADGEVGIYQVMPADIDPVELPEPEPSPPAEADGVAPETTAQNGEFADQTPEADDVTGGTTEPDDEFAESALETDTETTPAVGESRTEGDDSGARGAERTPSGPPGSKAAGASHGTAVDSGQSMSEEVASGSETDAAGTDRETHATDGVEREAAGESAPAEAADADSTSTAGGGERDDRAAGTPGRETGDAEPPTGETATREASSGVADPSETEPRQPEPRDHEPSEPEPRQPEPRDHEPSEPEPRQSETRERESGQQGHSEPGSSQASPGDAGTASQSTATKNRDESGAGATATALETRSIPSLDPEWSNSQTAVPPEPSPEPPAREAEEPTGSEPSTAEPPAQSPSEPERAEQHPVESEAPETGSKTAELEAELDEREHEITQLESEMRDLSAENEDLAAERDRLRAELEEARTEIERLEAQLEAVDTPAGGVELSAAEAIDGTNLFVRYHSKGEATLAKAQDGSADRAAVEENLRLEYHTQFDAEAAVVDGVEFETFLEESIQYRFVDWLVRNLLYEIRDTGHANPMSVLYQALPEVDRAELNGNVSVKYAEDGQENREQQQFDVVVRDRMGNPLVVANINDSRQPATDEQMTDIVKTAERVGNSSGSLSAAFMVTSSFFEPEALETAEEATSSGLFSRDKNKSFVNLSRKDGYHLCLLEARNQEFHLAVPEL